MAKEREWRIPHTLLAAEIEWLELEEEQETGGCELRSRPPASAWGETSKLSARTRRTRDALEEARMGGKVVTLIRPGRRRPRRSAPKG